MIFDNLGLPRDTGATDKQDSARLAGVMAVFKHPLAPNCRDYLVDTGKLHYVRHPEEPRYDFSRDQAVCLIAGLGAQKKHAYVNKDYIVGKDFFSPSHTGHIRLCQGLQPFLYQKLWFWLDVLYSVLFSPASEPNQMLCMLMTADRKYLRFWIKHNKLWEYAILDYWSGWRGEGGLATHIIQTIKEELK